MGSRGGGGQKATPRPRLQLASCRSGAGLVLTRHLCSNEGSSQVAGVGPSCPTPRCAVPGVLPSPWPGPGGRIQAPRSVGCVSCPSPGLSGCGLITGAFSCSPSERVSRQHVPGAQGLETRPPCLAEQIPPLQATPCLLSPPHSAWAFGHHPSLWGKAWSGALGHRARTQRLGEGHG